MDGFFDEFKIAKNIRIVFSKRFSEFIFLQDLK